MASYNRVVLVGNLTRDPELRYISSGTAVTEIGLAVNDRRKNQSGEWVDETQFIDITLWLWEVIIHCLNQLQDCFLTNFAFQDQFGGEWSDGNIASVSDSIFFIIILILIMTEPKGFVMVSSRIFSKNFIFISKNGPCARR